MTYIAPWATAICHLDPEKGKELANRIEKSYWIKSVEVLQEMLDMKENKDMLKCLNIPVPTERLIRSKILTFNCRVLETLNYFEIQHIIQAIYPGCDYGQTYFTHKINGLVLSTVESIDKLKEWGIVESAHAKTLWERLERWKISGVPEKLLVGYELPIAPAPQVSIKSFKYDM